MRTLNSTNYQNYQNQFNWKCQKKASLATWQIRRDRCAQSRGLSPRAQSRKPGEGNPVTGVPSKHACGRRQGKHSFLLTRTRQLSEVYEQVFFFIWCQLKSFAPVFYKMALSDLHHESYCVNDTTPSMADKNRRTVSSSYYCKNLIHSLELARQDRIFNYR